MTNVNSIQLGQQITSLLTVGRRQSTYKFALVMALMDYCIENLPTNETKSLKVDIKRLADYVIAYYWPQVEIYGKSPLFHGQSTNTTITKAIQKYKLECPKFKSASIAKERDAGYLKLQKRIAFELASNPISYLQSQVSSTTGKQHLLYNLSWEPGKVNQAQLDNLGWSIKLRPGVAWNLARLEPLLRPFIEMCWHDDIIRFNKELKEDKLMEFLFGAKRSNVQKVASDLIDLQSGKCFYCEKHLTRKGTEVDHVLPWSRTYIDGVVNLVATDKTCNGNKSDTLPVVQHFERAINRNLSDLKSIAKNRNFPVMFETTESTGLGLYKVLPPGSQLWEKVNVYQSS